MTNTPNTPASADALLTSRVEILFPLPMKLPDDFDLRLVDLLNEVCDAYEEAHPDRVMWPSEFGSAPKWSKRDAEFLGIAAAPDAAETGEPSFDDSTFQISITEREAYPEDIAARAKRKARTAASASDGSAWLTLDQLPNETGDTRVDALREVLVQNRAGRIGVEYTSHVRNLRETAKRDSDECWFIAWRPLPPKLGEHEAPRHAPPAAEPTPAPVEGVTEAIRERDRLFCEAIIATLDSSGPRLVCDTERLLHHFNVHRPDRSPELLPEYERARQRPKDDISAPRDTDCEAIRDERIGVLARAEDGSAAMTMVLQKPDAPRDFDSGTVEQLQDYLAKARQTKGATPA